MRFSSNISQQKNGHPCFLYVKETHLGNVRVVISDAKLIKDNGTAGAIDPADEFVPEVRSYTDIYPFGHPLPSRQFNSNSYRYGVVNGQEKDDEIAGSGNLYNAEFWEYDTRTARRWNIDPVFKEWESRYATFGGNPIICVDILGNDIGLVTSSTHKGKDKDKSAEESVNSFVQTFKEIFKGKVDVTTGAPKNDFGNETLITAITVKEGEKLNEQEQAAFDFYNGLITSENTTWVALEGCGAAGTDKGQFFAIRNDVENTEQNNNWWGKCGFNSKAEMVFNMQLISSLKNTGEASYTPGSIISLAFSLQKKDLASFRNMTGKSVEKVGYAPFNVGMFHNYASTIIKHTDGDVIKFQVNLTKSVRQSFPGYATYNWRWVQVDKEESELKVDKVGHDKAKAGK